MKQIEVNPRSHEEFLLSLGMYSVYVEGLAKLLINSAKSGVLDIDEIEIGEISLYSLQQMMQAIEKLTQCVLERTGLTTEDIINATSGNNSNSDFSDHGTTDNQELHGRSKHKASKHQGRTREIASGKGKRKRKGRR